MNYTNFLAGHPNEARRAELWKYFLYVYPASLIVRKANRDLQQFRVLWLELEMLRQTKGTDVFNNYFGYDMQSGRPL